MLNLRTNCEAERAVHERVVERGGEGGERGSEGARERGIERVKERTPFVTKRVWFVWDKASCDGEV
jgi:hypothetical protein